MSSTTDRATVHVPADLHERIVALAERNDRTIAAEVRIAIREHLAKEENRP